MRKSGRLHKKLQKLEHRFCIIVNICAYHGHTNIQKDKNMFFIDIPGGPKRKVPLFDFI